MSQWDLLLIQVYQIGEKNFADDDIEIAEGMKENGNFMFKEINENAYMRFREVMQILDIVKMNIDSLLYDNRQVVAAVIYLILATQFKIYFIHQKGFTTSIEEFVDLTNPFNKVFQQFLKQSFGFDLVFLNPVIKYASAFMQIQFQYKLPYAQSNVSILTLPKYL